MGKEESARLTDKDLCEGGLSIPARVRYGRDGLPHRFLQCDEIHEIGDAIAVYDRGDETAVQSVKEPT